MSYTLTPNLGLRIDSNMTADDKFNLKKIDGLAATLSTASSGEASLIAPGDVMIAASTGMGIEHVNGNITLDAGNNLGNDATSLIQFRARSTSFITGSIDFGNATTSNLIIDASAVAAPIDAAFVLHLAEYNHTDIAANTLARHSHSNKNILDLTEVAFTESLKTRYDASSASNGFLSYPYVLTPTDVSNGYVVLPSTPSIPEDTQVYPEGAPIQTYGVGKDYIVSGNRLTIGFSTVWAMGQALEASDSILVLYR